MGIWLIKIARFPSITNDLSTTVFVFSLQISRSKIEVKGLIKNKILHL